MTTIASGYDWVVSPHLRRDHAGHAAAHRRRERIQGEGAPTWTSLGVNTFQYTTGGGQDFLAGGTAGWSGSGFTGRVLRQHAVDRAGLRLDQGLAQPVVRRRVDAPAHRR